jgi:hypothetical protein
MPGDGVRLFGFGCQNRITEHRPLTACQGASPYRLSRPLTACPVPLPPSPYRLSRVTSTETADEDSRDLADDLVDQW